MCRIVLLLLLSFVFREDTTLCNVPGTTFWSSFSLIRDSLAGSIILKQSTMRMLSVLDYARKNIYTPGRMYYQHSFLAFEVGIAYSCLSFSSLFCFKTVLLAVSCPCCREHAASKIGPTRQEIEVLPCTRESNSHPRPITWVHHHHPYPDSLPK